MLVVAVLLSLAAKYPRHRHHLVLALVAANACVAMIQFDTNRNVVEMLEASVDSRGRRNMEVALSVGVADLVPAGATIMTTTWHAWLFDGPPLSSGLFTQFLRRRVYVVNHDLGPHKLRSLSQQLTRLKAPSFVTVERAARPRVGLRAGRRAGTSIRRERARETRYPTFSGLRSRNAGLVGGTDGSNLRHGFTPRRDI